MKKLNNKGFTLIELLAIIVILAIIMVVTIPTVLSSMGSAREEMFQTSVNSVADWVEKQYTQAMIQTYDPAFITACTSSNGYCATTEFTSGTETATTALSDTNSTTFLKASGVKPTNYSYIYVKVTNGRACVKLTASDSGDFSSYKGNLKSSTGCQ